MRGAILLSKNYMSMQGRLGVLFDNVAGKGQHFHLFFDFNPLLVFFLAIKKTYRDFAEGANRCQVCVCEAVEIGKFQKLILYLVILVEYQCKCS